MYGPEKITKLGTFKRDNNTQMISDQILSDFEHEQKWTFLAIQMSKNDHLNVKNVKFDGNLSTSTVTMHARVLLNQKY